MPVPSRQLIASLLLLFAACGDVHTVHVDPVTTTTMSVGHAARIVHRPAEFPAVRRAAVQKVMDFKRWTGTELFLLEAERSARVATQQGKSGDGLAAPRPAATTGSLAQVMQCIKDHESGDYTEHSHPDSGSGAYQYIPGTWRAWAARAGYPGWDLAYQAPPSVQDAVTAFTLSHGGAGNWSNRFGNDPCTGGI